MTSPNKNYIVNVAAALSGHEGFSSTGKDASVLYATSMTIIFIYMLFIIFFGIGAARLSYNYNISIGNTGGIALMWSVLSFLFSSFYYPYYALFLDPLGKKRVKPGRNLY